MSWIDRANAKFGRFAVPNLTVLLIAGQVIAFLANSAPGLEGAALLRNIQLEPDKVLQGEWWRLITFLFAPPTTFVLFAFFFWYLLYMFGTTLEANWGTFRYNVYLLLGYVASVVMAFVAWFAAGVPGQIATNGFLYGSVFLAFARLYPEFVMYIFFVLPVKIRWLAMFQWIMYGVTLISPTTWLMRAMVVAAVFNYLVFFGRDILRDMKHRNRRMQFQARALQGKRGRGRRMAHVCRVCGLSSADSPSTPFRYCSECGGDYCYCPEHLQNHEHVKIAGAT
ncbi:MAG: hypothetical protein WD971_03930 [Pirellulales bacterium]